MSNNQPSPEAIEEMVRQFIGITGRDESMARNWLEATCYDLMRAVDMFMEMDQQEKEKDKRTNDDLAAAAVSSCDKEEDYVRPADPVKRQKLVDYDSTMLGSVPNFQGGVLAGPASHYGADGLPTPNPFRDFGMESRRSTDDRGNGDGNNTNANAKRAKKLAELFEGDFHAARKEARERQLWLLVSLQLESEFDCLRMNRDTFKDDILQQVISASCVFWQPAGDTSFSRKYASLYGVNEYPHVAVIDPTTGREIWSKAGFIDAHSLTEAIMDVGDYKESMELIKSRAAVRVAAADVPLTRDEDTELIVAIEASLKDSMPSNNVTIQDSAVNVAATMGDRIKDLPETPGEKKEIKMKSPCPVTVEPPDDEPEAGEENVTSIRFIFPPLHKHITRRFLKTASVRSLYGFVLNILKADADANLKGGSSSSGKHDGPVLPFDLLRTYPRVSLKDCEVLDIASAGLENTAIKVECAERGDDD